MIIDIILPLSLIFIMFSLGLGLKIENFKNILIYPKAFILGLLNQMLLLPIITFTLVIIFNLSNELALGMMILSCCPGGVTSNIITKFSNGDIALSISYTSVVSLITMFTLPIIVGFSSTFFMAADAPTINIYKLGLTMFIVTTVPVSLGLIFNTKFKSFSTYIYPIANKVSTLLFIIIVFGALASEWSTFVDNIFTLGPCIVSLIFIMIFIGYKSPKLFGIDSVKAKTIAIESSIQNGTVGITIGNLILNNNHGLSVLSLPSGVYSILMYIVCLPIMFFILRNK